MLSIFNPSDSVAALWIHLRISTVKNCVSIQDRNHCDIKQLQERTVGVEDGGEEKNGPIDSPVSCDLATSTISTRPYRGKYSIVSLMRRNLNTTQLCAASFICSSF